MAGHLTVFAGNGITFAGIGPIGDGGLATDATMFEPSGMCIDSANNIYVADSDNAVVREIPATNQTLPFPMTAGHIYTVAGQQEINYTYGGDGLLATTPGAVGSIYTSRTAVPSIVMAIHSSPTAATTRSARSSVH